MRTLPRFVLVGLINTLFGYAAVMLGLRFGLGDYAANAAGYVVGFFFSYGMHRHWTFAAKDPPSLTELGRFGLAVGAAYACNVGVLYVARSAGFMDSPAAQAIAIGTYSIVFFLLTRFVVFTRTGQGDGSM
ncbi:MAG: hypothetical protein RLZZ08_747 [Pseudomonadota bacterium]|jgi:putative flippase GtrA